MKIAKLIFGRIWALWGLITFFITFLIFFLPSMLAYLMPAYGGQAYFLFVAKIWMRIWLFLIGCPIKITGKENFKKGNTYIIVYNHNALLDPPLSCPFSPFPNKTIAKKSFVKVPLFGWYYRKGAVLLDRKSEESRKRSYDEMKKVLLTGMHMCIYPEGTRNRTQEPMKAFYNGAFSLALGAKKDIMPCVITGTKKAMPPQIPFYLMPTKLTMQFLPPEHPGTDVEELKNRVRNKMIENYIARTSN